MTVYLADYVYLDDGNSRWKQRIVYVFLVLLCIVPLSQKYQKIALLYQKQNYRSSDRYQFETVIQEFSLPEQSKYLIYINSQKDWGYYYFLARYDFWTTNIYHLETFDQKDRDNLFGQCDYLIVIDAMEGAKSYFEGLGYSCRMGSTGMVVNIR